MTQLPIIHRHKYLHDHTGELIGFVRMTRERCPNCSPANRGTIGVVLELPSNQAESVHCDSCDYNYVRPRRDEPGRRMNQGVTGG